MKRLLIGLLLLLWPTLAMSQSIPLSYFGLTVQAPTVIAWPKIPFGTSRTWDVGDYPGFTRVSWRAIETSKGVYDWTLLNAARDVYKSHGVPFIYTFGYVPDWANGSAGQAVPPTDFQDFYDFVTAIVAHLGADCNLYELWNEQNSSALWTGTVAQANTMAQHAYPLIKAGNPNALVLSPSSVAASSLTWMDTFLANGGGSYFDIYSFHPYPWVTAEAGIYPEVVLNLMTYHNNLQKAYGLSKPIWATEFAQDGALNHALNTPVYTSVAMMMPLVAGADRAIWYVFDTARQVGNLAGTNQGLNASGVAYRSVASWLLNSTFTTPIARQANANGIRNPTMTGVVDGTPGTFPTNWSLNNPDSAKGISTQVVGHGTTNGVNWFDFRVFGTAGGTASGFIIIQPESSATQIAALNGQYWTYGFNVSLVGGSLANLTQIQQNIKSYTAAGAGIKNETAVHLVPTSLAIDQQTWWYTTQITGGATVAFVNTFFSFNYSAGAVIDVTLRIALPFADNGTIYQGDLTRANGAQSRIVWDSAGGPTAYNTATACGGGACGFARGVDASYKAISGNSVNLTNSPIILDTAAQAVRF